MRNISALFCVCICLLCGPRALGSEREVLSGRAEFQKRSTIVPFFICSDGVCPKPEPYWSLVVNSNGVNYEFPGEYALGSIVPPEMVEVAGVMIRPGTRMSVEARVERLGEQYAVLSDIGRVRLLMDLTAYGAPIDELPGFSRRQWLCDEAMDTTGFHVDVLYSGAAETTPDVALHISGQQKILIPNVSVDSENGTLVFEGRSGKMSATLFIEPNSGSLEKLPAQLHLYGFVGGDVYRVPVEKEARLLCNYNNSN